MTYALAVHFATKGEGRKAFLKTAEDAAKMYQASIILQPNGDVTMAGIAADEVAPLLTATGMSPYAEWPQDVVTCDIETPLPLRAVGMEDGWEVFLGDNVFVGFVSMPDDAVRILERAGAFYTNQEKFETLPHFVERIGLDAFRREVLGVEPLTDASALPPEYTSGGDFYNLAYDPAPPTDWDERPAARTLHHGDFVRPDDNLMQILTVYPEMGPLFMEYGMHCIGCVISYDESLWEACQVHGLDIFEIMGEMNEYLADKLGKELITGETPLQELFTMYPQTVSVLQEYGISLPDEMSTTLGALAAERSVSEADLLAQIHRKLRKEV